ncbi:MAG: peptide chain release factor-like protein [Desulfotignum sp.]|nr:peptide chain release factor-like protein [Desulfotignum sp.]MCF8138282.1 peptide chain release factor-like protein [Desulfotignum sp.]
MASRNCGPSEKKQAALEKKLENLGIRKTDLEEKFIKSSGRGGQKVNKSSSAVFLRHTVTGLSVKVGKHRSLHLNRFLALRALAEKIDDLQSGRPPSDMSDSDRKIQKQKRRRRQKTRKKLAGSKNKKIKDE